MATKKNKTEKQSPKATGLKIERNGYKFTFSWSSPAENRVQAVQYRINGKTYKDIDVSRSQTQVVYTLQEADYFPIKPGDDLLFNKIDFRVKRCNPTTDTVVYTPSDWNTETWEAKSLKDSVAPKRFEPVHEVNHQQGSLLTIFSFDVEKDATSHYWITGIEYEKCWTKSEHITDPKNIKEFTGNNYNWRTDHNKWHSHMRKTSLPIVIDDPETVEEFADVGMIGMTYTRWYRYRTYGPHGVGTWHYCWYTYGYPYRSQINTEKSTIAKQPNSSTYRITVKWVTPQHFYTRPTDSIDIEYCVAKPKGIRRQIVDPDEYQTQTALYKQTTLSDPKSYKKVAHPIQERLDRYYEYNEGSDPPFRKTTDVVIAPNKTYYLLKKDPLELVENSKQLPSGNYFILKDLLPEGDPPSWEKLVENYIDTRKNDSITKQIDMAIPENCCVWVRVVAKHDEWVRVGWSVLLTPANFRYELSAPTGLYVEPGEEQEHGEIICEVGATDSTDIEDASMVVVCKEKGASSSTAIPIAVMDKNDQTPWQVYIPPEIYAADPEHASGLQIGVYSALLWDYDEEPHTDSDGNYMYSEIDDMKLVNDLYSDTSWEGGLIPARPLFKSIEYVDDEVEGPSIYVKWSNAKNVDETEISWSDRRNAWNSDSDPSAKVVKVIKRPELHIYSVEKGKKYYLRGRSIRYDNDKGTYSGYTGRKNITLADEPWAPILQVSRNAVPRDGSFVASWDYTNDDGTTQKSATIVPVILGSYKLTTDISIVQGKEYYTRSGTEGKYVYTLVPNPVASQLSTYYEKVDDGSIFDYGESIAIINSTEQSYTFSADDLIKNKKWVTDKDYYLAVTVTSSADKISPYSMPVNVRLLDPIQCTISATSLISQDGRLWLKSLPLTVTVTGAGFTNRVVVSIIREHDYMMMRPNEDMKGGYEGDVVTSAERFGDGTVTFTSESLNRDVYFDDGATYRIKAVITDEYGQTSESNELSDDERVFTINWTDQALLIPPENASVVIDNSGITTIAKITVQAPEGANVGGRQDRIDIYRLSADKPELIVKNGLFGTTYVDPFPTIGDNGGYRVVFMTANGDYIAPNSRLAWLDLDIEYAELYDLVKQMFFKSINNIITFGESDVYIPWNIDLSTNWKKDFKETKYLGGHILGDWNEGVSRSGSINTQVQTDDADTITRLRRLAVYSGMCHVRTVDGSNYKANVEVSESYSYQSHVITTYSLNITRVDSLELDGMTLDEWNSYNQ